MSDVAFYAVMSLAGGFALFLSVACGVELGRHL